ncbi:MAG: hypothetical protein HZT43_12160 [Exiguobacterium profundum]|nr:MAG: hypothetical protein HZT43_12160 [Exiguobacterium profundum]
MAIPVTSTLVNARLAEAGAWFDSLFATQGLTRLQGYGLPTVGLLLRPVVLLRRKARQARAHDRR